MYARRNRESVSYKNVTYLLSALLLTQYTQLVILQIMQDYSFIAITLNIICYSLTLIIAIRHRDRQ